MKAGWKCSTLRRKNYFIKHSVWVKFPPVLGIKVTFTLVIYSTDWIPHLPVGSLSFLHTETDFTNLFSWGSLGVFSICSLGLYITLNGAATRGRRRLSLFVLTWGSRFEASWAPWLKTKEAWGRPPACQTCWHRCARSNGWNGQYDLLIWSHIMSPQQHRGMWRQTFTPSWGPSFFLLFIYFLFVWWWSWS